MAQFSLTRSAVINAPATTVHGLLSDFREWKQWSPWEHKDPDLKRTYTGPRSGAGAKYAWVGNKQVGTGRMEILNASPERIDIDLVFIEPWAAENLTVFELAEAGGSTTLTWTMNGERNLLMTLMGKLFFDRAIGKDFQKGLADIKRAAESS